MNYLLIRLGFDTAVHFGASDSAQSLATSQDHLPADTLFSALCHTALQLYGPAGIEQLCTWVKSGELLLSDMLPWRGDDCFLPRPCALAAESGESEGARVKAMKKLLWIPALSFDEYAAALRSGRTYDAEPVSFGLACESTRASLGQKEEAVPYRVGLFRFEDNCGLYVIAALCSHGQKEMLMALFRALGLGGIGGKVSSGCGKFHVVDAVLLKEGTDPQARWLYGALKENRGHSLLLSASLPRDDELDKAMEGARYRLLRRSGFVASDTYSPEPMKKRTQYFFRTGSVFLNRYEGALYQVGGSGSHPVYRYGRPLFLGVKL